jgi:hypothetical protein
MVRCHDATTGSFVAKVREEVLAHFHAVTVKRHGSMWNYLRARINSLGTIPLMSEKIMSVL